MKLGKAPAEHSLRTMRSALRMASFLDPLGAPPATCDYYRAVEAQAGQDWRMFCNDQYGCCVWADTAHALMQRTANAGSIVYPSDADVLAAYSAVTGFDPRDPSTDRGTSETAACQWLMSTGFAGHKSAGTAMLDPRDLDHVRWCISIFGTCRLGLYPLPQSAMDQYDAGQPWTWVANSPSVGGHDVPLVGYDENWFYCVSWGRRIPVASAFITAYCDEAHAELYPDWVRAQGTAPNGLDLAQLEVDLRAISYLKLRSVAFNMTGTEAGIAFWCPGCRGSHAVRTSGGPGPNWDWDGNVDLPTISPSVLTRMPRPDGDRVCHSFVRAGCIQFLDDCTHDMKGQTTVLPDWPGSGEEADFYLKAPHDEVRS